MRDAGGTEGELHVSEQEGGRVRVRVARGVRQQGRGRAALEGQGRARVGFVSAATYSDCDVVKLALETWDRSSASSLPSPR